MAKNITIAEGSQAKNFNTVHKLRTNLIGGGTQYWVPEDEAGAYANMGQKSITANGTYRASDDGKDGYSQVTVNVPPKEAHLTTKSISENGIYRGIDDGVDGFSQVNVNVAGVGEATVTLDEPIGGDGNEHFITTNPSTGKPVDIVLPSSIKIITSATKLRYMDGENVDITGIVVQAYKNDGTVWEDASHSGGYIPISELIYEPKVAHVDADGDGHEWSDEDGVNAMVVELNNDGISSLFLGSFTSSGVLYKTAVGHRGNGYASLLLTKYSGNNMIYGMRTSGNNSNFDLYGYNADGVDLRGGTSAATQMNTWTSLAWEDEITEVPISTKNPMDAGTMHSVGMKVTIKWNRPRDNKVLRVTYGVTVH